MLFSSLECVCYILASYGLFQKNFLNDNKHGEAKDLVQAGFFLVDNNALVTSYASTQVSLDKKWHNSVTIHFSFLHIAYKGAMRSFAKCFIEVWTN